MNEEKMHIIGIIQDHIAKCGGYDKLNTPISFNLWCWGNKYYDVTFLSIVDVMKGIVTDTENHIVDVTHDLYAIDTNGEIWNIDDFLTEDQLREIWYALNTKKVTVKLSVDVTFDVTKECDQLKIESLARQMVADKLDYDLNTCYGDETYVDYNVTLADNNN